MGTPLRQLHPVISKAAVAPPHGPHGLEEATGTSRGQHRPTQWLGFGVQPMPIPTCHLLYCLWRESASAQGRRHTKQLLSPPGPQAPRPTGTSSHSALGTLMGRGPCSHIVLSCTCDDAVVLRLVVDSVACWLLDPCAARVPTSVSRAVSVSLWYHGIAVVGSCPSLLFVQVAEGRGGEGRVGAPNLSLDCQWTSPLWCVSLSSNTWEAGGLHGSTPRVQYCGVEMCLLQKGWGCNVWYPRCPVQSGSGGVP